MQNRYTAMKFNSQKDFRGLDGEECSYDRTKQNKQTNKNKGMEREKGKKTCKQTIPMTSWVIFLSSVSPFHACSFCTHAYFFILERWFLYKELSVQSWGLEFVYPESMQKPGGHIWDIPGADW